VLRSAVHNYPSCANIIWAKVQYIVLDLLQMQSLEDQRDANFGLPKEESSIKGRCLVAAIKVIFTLNVWKPYGWHLNVYVIVH
jgi:hypothetical protein